jgi:hypothetical protein
MSFIFGGVAFYHKDFTLGMVDLSYSWENKLSIKPPEQSGTLSLQV